MEIPIIKSAKNVFTRKCIGEAIVALLKETELASLKVREIVVKAGVSRMTFYKYYSSPKSALKDYLKIIIAEYLEKIREKEVELPFFDYNHILFALNFFDQYRPFFLTLNAKGMYSLLINSVNEFMDEHFPLEENASVYKRYSFAGSLLNCFIVWEVNGKKESAEEVATTIYELYGG